MITITMHMHGIQNNQQISLLLQSCKTNMINVSQGNVASPFGKWCYHVPSSQQGTISSVSYQSDHIDMNVSWFCWCEPI